MDKRFVMLHDGKWVVEVMKKSSPLLVLGRAPKAFGVILEPVPLHEEQVARSRIISNPFAKAGIDGDALDPC